MSVVEIFVNGCLFMLVVALIVNVLSSVVDDIKSICSRKK